jgi:8-amino-7-oxononanoate synthase
MSDDDGRGSDFDARLSESLRVAAKSGLRRELDDGALESVERRRDFESNDVLGLSRDPRVVAAAHDALERHGAGARAARLLGGGTELHARAESAVAEWLRAEAALLFPSGWQANAGLLGALAGRGDALFSDELNHASLIDGGRLTRARVQVFRHRDLDELERLLARARANSPARSRRFVVTESLFSMDGDLAELGRMHELCERHDAWLVVDEAHAVGLLGPEGAGAWAASGVATSRASRLVARIVTGGKALGVGGAFVVGSVALRDTLLQRARSFLFTTAPPPAVAGALVAAIDACRGAQAQDTRARALVLAKRLAVALDVAAPAASIVPFVVADPKRTVELAHELRAAGFAVGAVRPPSVPRDGSRLRLVTHAFNDEAAVDELVKRIRSSLEKKGSIGSLFAPRSDVAPRAPAWIVVGTDTGVGKTVASALLVRAANRLGPVAYWKPVQTGDEDDSEVVRELAGSADVTILSNEHHFPLPASPHEAAAAADSKIDPYTIVLRLLEERRRLAASTERRASRRTVRLIVELAGGLLVPYHVAELGGVGGRTGVGGSSGSGSTFLQSDLVAAIGRRVVVVARSGLGTLNHTLLTLEALRARHVEPAALLLVGDRHPSNAATLRELGGVAATFEVARFAPLTSAALDAWLDSPAARGLDDVLAADAT